MSGATKDWSRCIDFAYDPELRENTTQQDLSGIIYVWFQPYSDRDMLQNVTRNAPDMENGNGLHVRHVIQRDRRGTAQELQEME